MEELWPLSNEEELPQVSVKNSHCISLASDKALRGLGEPADDFLFYEVFCCWNRS